MNDVGLVIPAAGRGERFGGDREKALAPLGEKPLLTWTLLAFEGFATIAERVVAVPAGREEAFEAGALRPFGLAGRVKIVAGGATRQESVARGVEALGAGVRTVLVHDAARPLVSPALVARVLERAEGGESVIPALLARDSVARAGAAGEVAAYEDRRALLLVQTPQGFPRSTIARALDAARGAGTEGTDEAMLVLDRGVRVTWVEGEIENVKITYPQDLALAEAVLRRRSAAR